MKHLSVIKRMLAKLHESWMDDEDKEFFDAEMIRMFGDELDENIEKGIANGYTEKQQEFIVRSILSFHRRMVV